MNVANLIDNKHLEVSVNQDSDIRILSGLIQTLNAKLQERVGIDPSNQYTKYLHMTKIQEEVGELAEELLKSDQLQRREKGEFNFEDLESELADVIFALLYFADTLGIDIPEMISKRIQKDCRRYAVVLEGEQKGLVGSSQDQAD